MLKRVPLVLSLFVIASGSIRHAQAATTVIVDPGNMNGWAFAQENQATGSGSLVTGPAPVPLGIGSAELTVDGTGQEILFTTTFTGTSLSSITSLQYSAYRSTFDAGNSLAIGLLFDVNYDLRGIGNANEGRLVYEPKMTPGVGGTIMEDTWYTWNALQGRWWATKSPGSNICPQSDPCTWAQVLAAYPYAGIRGPSGYLLFKAGGPWAGGFSGSVDALTIGISGVETTYDFELETGITPETTIDSSFGVLTNSPSAEFTFSGTDDFTPVDQLTFECQLDGGDWEACNSPESYNNLLDGSHMFQVRAIDPADLADPTPASHTWEIDTQAPSTADLTALPNPSLPGAAISFSATIDDAAAGNHRIASAEYTSDGGNNWTSLPASDGDFDSVSEQVEGSLTAPQEGTVELCVRGRDAAGNTGEAACTTLTVDTPPTVAAGGPYSGQEGSPVNMHASASDIPGSTLAIQWIYTPGGDVDVGTVCTFEDSYALETSITCDDDGTYTLEVSVDDGVYLPVTAQAELTLINASPQVEIISPTEGEELDIGETVNLQAIYSDAGANDTHTCQIDWGDGSLPDTPQECSGQDRYNEAGDYTLQVTVEDDDGLTGNAQISITVLEKVNEPPTAGAGGPYTGTEGQTVQLQGSASDPEQNPLTISWSYQVKNGVKAGTTCTFGNKNALQTSFACNDNGVFELILTVSDGTNPPVRTKTTIALSNQAPTVRIAKPSQGNQFFVDTPVDLNAIYEEIAAHDTVTCQIDWGVTETALVPETAGSCQGSYTFNLPGTYKIQVIAQDDDTGASSDSVLINVIEEVESGNWIFIPVVIQ